jgi:hypothetical protein
VSFVTAWGLLPIALALACVTMLGLGALTLPHDSVPFGERLLGGMLLTLATVAVLVRVLGAAGVLTTAVVIGAGLIITANTVVAVRIRGLKTWPRCWPVSMSTLPVLVVAAGAVVIATLAAYLLPVWQWDALGYHLPYVNFALQRGTFADIPVDVPFLSTYPHVVEDVFIAWRALIPDDRLVELGHLPFGVLGATAIAVIAYRQGARAGTAVAAGAVWLTLPAVFLQLPTNYVDVASAALLLTSIAFVLGPVDRTRIILAATALGLFLGSKPTAPLAAMLVFTVLAVAAWRSGLRGTIGSAAVVVLLLGGESYLTNLVRQGNPVWPVRIDLGPIHLPGRFPMSDLLASGAGAPRAQGSLATRVFDSWTTIWPAVPAFDMRVGGLGVLILVALPFALIRVVRQRSVVIVLVFVATLATPDPAVVRYVLAFAGLVLAFAVPTIDHQRVGKFVRASALVLVALGAAHNVYVAYPGLTGEGPPLRAYVDMSDYERRRAVGADGVPTPFLDAVANVGPGEIAVFDERAYLPYLAWPPDLSRDAMRIPDDATAEEADRLVHADDVRLLIVGDDTVGGSVVRRDPARFVRIFECKSSTCAVYLRR